MPNERVLIDVSNAGFIMLLVLAVSLLFAYSYDTYSRFKKAIDSFHLSPLSVTFVASYYTCN